MKKFALFDNLGLKILALFLSLIIWLIVTNYNDPIIYKQFNAVPVRLVNTEMITDQGQVYRVLDGTDTVPTVTVGVPRSVADELTKDNIVATADVEDITQLDTVPIYLTTNVYSARVDSIRGSIENVRLSIENRESATFTLQAETIGEPMEGYSLSDISMDQNQVRVIGPTSVVSTINKVVAVVDVSGARGTIVTYADVVLYDENEAPIDASELEMNIRSVRMTVNVLAAKTVPILPATSGAPADGYLRNGSVSANPSEVTLKGRSSALADVQSIEIPAEVLNVSGRSSDLIQEVDITPFLPDNLEFADSSFQGIVEVVVGIEQAQTRSFSFATADVLLENIPDGYTAEVTAGDSGAIPETVTVTLSGLQDVVDNVSPDFLTPRINVGALLTGVGQTDLSGVYSSAVQVTLPRQVVLHESSRLNVLLKAIGDAPLTSTPTTEATETTGAAETAPAAEEGETP